MRALLVVVMAASAARAQPIRRAPISWTEIVPRDRMELEKGWLVGKTLTHDGQPDLEVGYHVTARLIVRAHVLHHALEAAYAFGVGKIAIPCDAILRAKMFAFTGFDGERVHAGLSLRTYPVQGADWITLELGARSTYVDTHGFVAMTILFDPLERWFHQ